MDRPKNILYVEDNTIYAVSLQLLCKAMGHNCVLASNYEEGLKQFYELKPDLLIIDINLGSIKSGLDLAIEIGDDITMPLIYLTAEISDEVFEHALATNPTTFLNKPISKINLQRSIEFCFRSSQKTSDWGDVISDAYFVREGRELKRISLAETHFIEVTDKYCSVHTTTNSYLIRIQLKNLMNLLPDNFLQIHRSYVINLDFLKSLNQTRRKVVVADSKLPVGRSYYEELKSYVNRL